VHTLQFIFNRTVATVLVVLICISCNDIPRDNPLDPKNPDSYRSQVILVEAFVNTNQALADSLPVNQFMLSALNQFKERHENKVVIAEYHRGSYEDSLAQPEFNLLYDKYLNGLNSSLKGVPDIFMNGILARVTGASSVETALTRLETAFEPFLTAISEYTLEPKVIKTDTQIEIEVEIAKLGDSDAEDIVIRAVLIEDLGSFYLRRVVRRIWSPEIIPSLPNGETKTVNLSTIPLKQNSDRSVIITVSSEDELEKYQAIEVRLNE
jgi:hypothetical protein